MRHLLAVSTLAVVMMVSSPAMAAMTLYANWNGGDPPAGADPSWEGIDFNYSNRLGPPDPAVEFYELMSGTWWTKSTLTASGKFGSGLDATQNPAYPNKATGGYTIANWAIKGNTMLDAAGTMQFWFKPNWDPATEADIHHIVSTQQYYPAEYNGHRVDIIHDVGGANSRLEFTNMGGSATTSVAYDPAKVLADWNHMAICWDAAGTRLYMNGAVAAISPDKMAVAEIGGPSGDDQYLFIGGRQAPPASVDMYGADGIFDDFALYTTALYTGASYDIPGPIDIGPLLFGDLNVDGFVGQADLDIVLGVWGQSVPPADGRADPSSDGFVGQADLDTVLGNWGHGTLLPAIPEPVTLSLLTVGGLTLGKRRR